MRRRKSGSADPLVTESLEFVPEIDRRLVRASEQRIEQRLGSLVSHQFAGFVLCRLGSLLPLRAQLGFARWALMRRLEPACPSRRQIYLFHNPPFLTWWVGSVAG